MMDFGNTLRAAREAKGYSIAQLAESTRLAPATIVSLENGDVKHIAAPIYGRGFVRLYCEAVGLDPKPFIDEFMEIMQGNRSPAIKERAPAVEVMAPRPEPVPTPVAPEPPQRQEPPFRQTLSHAPVSPRQVPETHDSRYAAPMRTPAATFSVPWRLIVLAIGAGVVLALIVFSLRALHRATAPAVTPVTAAEAEEASFGAPVTPAQPAPVATVEPTVRRQQDIPALYID